MSTLKSYGTQIISAHLIRYSGLINLSYLWGFISVSGITLALRVVTSIVFMGYVLPWGQMSFWGAAVITNLFTTIPYVGDSFVNWLWGGFSVDNPTLNRSFIDCFEIAPFLLSGVVGGWRKRLGSWRIFILTKLLAFKEWIVKYIIPLAVVYIIVCIYFGLYLRLGITVFFVVVFQVRELPAVKGVLVQYREGCAIADGHWERDRDLIWLWRFVRVIGALALVSVLVMGFWVDLIMGSTAPWACVLKENLWVLPYIPGFVILFLGVVVIIADAHVCYCRNPRIPPFVRSPGGPLDQGIGKVVGQVLASKSSTGLVIDPTIGKIISGQPVGLTKVSSRTVFTQMGRGAVFWGKFVAVTGGTIGIGQIFLSYCQYVDPSMVGNTYQQLVGRGYGVEDSSTHQRHNIFKCLPSYDPKACVDPATGNVTFKLTQEFVVNNMKEVQTHLTSGQKLKADVPMDTVELFKRAINYNGRKGL